MNNFDLKKFLTENKLTSNSRILNEGMERLVYQIPNDTPDSALKPYTGKFLRPGNSVNNMVSTANEYEKEGGLFKYLPNSIELTPPVALSSFGKSLGKPEVAKNGNEKPAEYRDESGKKVKNKDFDINKVSYKLVNETEYKNELFGMGGGTKLQSLQPFTIEFADQDTLKLVMQSPLFAKGDKGERVTFRQDTVVVGKPLSFEFKNSQKGGTTNVTKITSLGKDIKKLNVKDLEKGQYRIKY